MLEILELSKNQLPSIIKSGEIIGKVTSPKLPELSDTFVVTGGADNAAAAYGCGVEFPGDTLISLETSGTVVNVVENPVIDFF